MVVRIILLVFISLSFIACNPFSRLHLNDLLEREEQYLINKTNFERSDINSVVSFSKALRDFMLKYPKTGDSKKVEKILDDVNSKAQKLGNDLFQQVTDQEREIIANMLPFIDTIEKISQNIVTDSNKRSYFDRPEYKKNECMAIYLGRELDKFKMNLKIGKANQVGKTEIKMKILLDTQNFTLSQYPRLRKVIDTEEQIYNYKLQKSIKMDCDTAEKLSAHFLQYETDILDLLAAHKDYRFLSLYLRLADLPKIQ